MTIHKNGDINDTNNYRGLTLLPTAYKIYAEVIRSRLIEEVEEKKLLPECQADFRKERSSLDNIFVLDHLIRKTNKKNKSYMHYL